MKKIFVIAFTFFGFIALSHKGTNALLDQKSNILATLPDQQFATATTRSDLTSYTKEKIAKPGQKSTVSTQTLAQNSVQTSAQVPVKNPAQIGVLEALREASLIVQFTMILLAFMSVVSWAIILSKWSLFKNNRVNNIPFEDIFFKASSLDEIFDMSKSYPKSSLTVVFRAGYSELKKIISSKHSTGSSQLLSGIDNLQRALNKAVNNEISYMERRLAFLATTGSVSPFIGLFGTVFGIMNSFQQIGAMGSANLAVVAPGISEALIATGFGLFAAIPAAVFYNHFINEIKKAELQFNNFVTDFLNISKRNFFK